MSPMNDKPMLSVTCYFVDAPSSGSRVVVCMLKNIGDKPLALSCFPGFLADWRVSTPITNRQNAISGKVTTIHQSARCTDGPRAGEVLILKPGDKLFDTIYIPESLTNQTGFIWCKVAFESRGSDPALWRGRVEMKGEMVFKSVARKGSSSQTNKPEVGGAN